MIHVIGWHGCFICHKVSKYQCFCCPISICKVCINSAAFVRFKKKKGFCNDCLKLALLIEENKDVDSDGVLHLIFFSQSLNVPCYKFIFLR